MVYHLKQEYDRAFADFDQAIRLDPKQAYYLVNRGIAYLAKEDVDRATEDFNQAIRVDPHYGKARSVRGFVHFIRGEFELAKQDEILALRAGPTDAYAAIWLYLAQARSAENGNPQLRSHSAGLRLVDWPGPVVELYLGKISPEAVITSTPSGSVPRLCEANFYLGERAVLLGNKREAARLFRAAIATRATDNPEYHAAKAELARSQLEH